MDLQIAIDAGAPRVAAVLRFTGGARLWIDGREHRATFDPVGRCFDLQLDDRCERIYVAVDHDDAWVHAFGRAFAVQLIDPSERSRQAAEQADTVTAPMPGTVITVAVQPGEEVTTGQPLVVIESMKMQSEITAWRDGVIERIHVRPGDSFDRGAGLVALAPEEEAA